MMTAINWDEIDPGIVDIVRAMRDHGWNTTDSGDGVTKAELIEEGAALPMPHVFATVAPSQMKEEAERLLEFIRTYANRDARFKGAHVAVSYSPIDGVAVLEVYGLEHAPEEVKRWG